MYNYYLLDVGECVTTAESIGKFEDLQEAKNAVMKRAAKGDLYIKDGDMVLGFSEDVDPEYEDEFGYWTVNAELAESWNQSTYTEADGTVEGIPQGKIYWSDDDEIIYNADGTKWE